MLRRLRKAQRKLRGGNASAAFRALVTPHHTETRILTARQRVSDHLRRTLGNTVAHGPFTGMTLPGSPYWGGSDISAKLLGTYERQVTERLVDLSRPNGVLLDIGSADGYFAIGAIRAGLFARCLCFERSEKGQAVLSENARINGVADKIHVEGEATTAALLAGIETDRPVILCDIEGGEFELFTEDLLNGIAGSYLIIELHDDLVEGGSEKKQALLDRASKMFDIEIVGSSLPDPYTFTELAPFDDDHRLLALSEGRDRAMEWLVLTPKSDR